MCFSVLSICAYFYHGSIGLLARQGGTIAGSQLRYYCMYSLADVLPIQVFCSEGGYDQYPLACQTLSLILVALQFGWAFL